MPTTEKAMHIGVVLPQVAADWEQVLEATRHAEDNGADSVWVIDHVLGFPPPKGILEAWTLMSAVAASTSRVEIGAQVLCQSFRNPSLLAKMAATLDRVSNGRLRMLIGAGWFEQEYRQYGYDFPAPGVRIGELRDTVRILRGLLSEHDGFSYDGEHYSVKDAVNLPLPVQLPLPIEIGGAGDRLIRTVAFMGDGWNSPGAALGMLDSRLELLRATMAERGRSMDELRLSCQIVCAVGDDDAANHPGMAMFSPSEGFIGSIDDAKERAKVLMDKGLTDFNCVVGPGPRGRACLERLLEARAQL